jgi:hypothetical protein
MQRTISLLALAALVAALTACGKSGGDAATASPPPATPSPYLLGRRGVDTPEQDALLGIAFKPFVPTHRYVLTALLAPYHGSDTRENRGIGYEYREGGRLYVLSQWPANGRSAALFPNLKISEPNCTDVHAFPGGAQSRGIVWSTPRGTVVALQSDGSSTALQLQAEWHRLVRRGACR